MNDKGNQKSDVKSIIKAIKKHEIVSYYDVPEELRNNLEIVKAERKEKMRVLTVRGYDVIRQFYFTCELVNYLDYRSEISQREIWIPFNTFDAYYKFTEGKIYENACYYQCTFTKEQIEKYNIDMSKLNTKSLETRTVDESMPFGLFVTEEEYEQGEKRKRNIKKWIARYNKCETLEELIDTNERHKKSTDMEDESFYLWNYINTYGEEAFDIIMGFVNKGGYPAFRIEDALPFIFEHERIIDKYNYSLGAKTTCARHKSKFKAYVKRIEEKGYIQKVSKYFDTETHFYCIQTEYYLNDRERPNEVGATIYEYFEDFSSFSEVLHKDLSDCDLLYARGIDIDDTYIVNCETKLPVNGIENLNKIIEKRYNRRRDMFEVTVKWLNEMGKDICTHNEAFVFFFDFAAYLKNDLSDADLIYCRGLKYLNDYSEIDFTGALLTSKVLDAIGLKYSNSNVIKTLPKDNEIVLKNEESTAMILKDEHLEVQAEQNSNYDHGSENKVYYISDIHLNHKLIKFGAKTRIDMICLVQNIIDDMFREFPIYGVHGILLIGGDVSSEFEIFELFLDLLRKTIDERKYDLSVIFVLGNHELWNYEGKSISYIVEKYRTTLNNYGMHLLHEEIICYESKETITYISKIELLSLKKQEIRDRVRKARLILFGGIGYAGCNADFNATDGIYRETISRKQEILLSESFGKLYNRVENILGDKKIIVFTHMNIDEWKNSFSLHEKWIYVSGHSHRNAFYDDGITRLYADNQIGYYNTRPSLKYFLIDNSYDWFVDYEDGVYNISRNEYIEFYRGKNLPISFNRDINTIYMLKRNGYYCFIQGNKSGKLTMLNGGALKALPCDDVEYYYQNMDAQINFIKTPLMKYQEYQKAISDEIKRIGGNGHIHGAIIDIDGTTDENGWSSIAYNHLYVNPIDMSITPYFAFDVIEKYVYPSFAALISERCPKLHENYKKLLTGKEKNSLIIPVDKKELIKKPVLYTDTDIYKASRELRKMQKLNSNILSTWFDNAIGIEALPYKERKGRKQYGKSSLIGTRKMMSCGMEAEIVEYKGFRNITIRFDDGTIVEHISKAMFDHGVVWNPNSNSTSVD